MSEESSEKSGKFVEQLTPAACDLVGAFDALYNPVTEAAASLPLEVIIAVDDSGSKSQTMLATWRNGRNVYDIPQKSTHDQRQQLVLHKFSVLLHSVDSEEQGLTYRLIERRCPLLRTIAERGGGRRRVSILRQWGEQPNMCSVETSRARFIRDEDVPQLRLLNLAAVTENRELFKLHGLIMRARAFQVLKDTVLTLSHDEVDN